MAATVVLKVTQSLRPSLQNFFLCTFGRNCRFAADFEKEIRWPDRTSFPWKRPAKLINSLLSREVITNLLWPDWIYGCLCPTYSFLEVSIEVQQQFHIETLEKMVAEKDW
jgi:hypothetical protein